MYCLKLIKKVKKLKSVKIYHSRWSWALSTFKAGRARLCKLKKCIDQNLEIDQQAIYEKTEPYLDNPSEEATSESNQIKGQHERVKILDEEVASCSKNTWSLDNDLNRPVHNNAVCIIKYSNIDKVEIVLVLHDEVVMLTSRRCETQTRDHEQRLFRRICMESR